MIDVGAGRPVVVIPGVQGRWEWMRPAIDSLATHARVITGSLPGEPGTDPFADDAVFDCFVAHVDRLMDAAGVESAAICGVSFGGLVALRYAARRQERVKGLILVSTPGPAWRPDPQLARYLRKPALYSPMFLLRAPQRFWPELRATFPGRVARLRFCGATVGRLLAAPAVPSRMSHRARLASGEQFADDCARIVAPTLIVAGEQSLDRVIDVNGTMEYAARIPGATFKKFSNTGHLGTISEPDRFAAIVSGFMKELCW